jgi:hypothetical protein
MTATARRAIRPLGFWRVALAENKQGVTANCAAQQIPVNVAISEVGTLNLSTNSLPMSQSRRHWASLSYFGIILVLDSGHVH